MEGVGGWQVPLSNGLAVPVLVREFALPVMRVVGVRFGCLNHTLLGACNSRRRPQACRLGCQLRRVLISTCRWEIWLRYTRC